MRFFLDTAVISDIKALMDTGMVDGVTTNPSLIAKSGQNFIEVITEITNIVKGPVSAEVASTDFDNMILEGRKLADIAENIAVKVPLTVDGLRVCKALSDDNIMVNVTLCFTPNQALLAAKAGASFVSPFVGRLDDMNFDGMELIEDIVTLYDNYPEFDTEILVASIRSTEHMQRAALLGADVATFPPHILKQMYDHPLTAKGLAAFVEDWKATGQSIL